MSGPELEVIKDIPGYKVILKAVLKSQIQQLVEQLAEHTDEESVILTASLSDGTLSHLGSTSGKSFLVDHEDIKSQFLGFCLRRHHKEKQHEKEDAIHHSTASSRAQGQRFSSRSTRFQSPQEQGVFPVTLSRASPSQSHSVRHEPYQRPKKRSLNLNQEGRGHSLSPGTGHTSQVIKVEASDPDAENYNVDASQQLDNDGLVSSHPSSPSQANNGSNLSASFKSGNLEREDDDVSESSAPAAPNEASESAPQEGFNLNSKMSSFMPNVDELSGDIEEDSAARMVKIEAISESDVDLSITGIDIAAQQSAAEGYGIQGASGSQADMQHGYNRIHASKLKASNSTKTMYFEDSPSPVRAHVCDICGKPFPSAWELKRHVRTHTGERPYKCHVCSRAFADRSNMNQHVRTMHIMKRQKHR